MPSCTPFHSVNEVDKLPEKRVHHNNSACAPGQTCQRTDIHYGRIPGVSCMSAAQ